MEQRLRAQRRSVEPVRHVACSGAVIDDILTKQLTGPNALLDWVTISIGGNDLGFVPLIEYCIDDDCSNFKFTQQQLDDVGTKLAGLYREVRRITPNARHMVVLYPQVMSPTVTTTCPYGIRQKEAVAMREAWAAANEKIKQVAKAEQWEVLETMATAFDGNTVCDREPYANEAVLFDRGASYHPNNKGQNRMAQLLLASGTIPQ